MFKLCYRFPVAVVAIFSGLKIFLVLSSISLNLFTPFFPQFPIHIIFTLALNSPLDWKRKNPSRFSTGQLTGTRDLGLEF